MNTLLLDTSTNLEIVAIRYNTIIIDKTTRTTSSHSVTLFDSIDAACKALDITIHSIQCIAVGIGPGSFTGIRIAVSTARMFSQILKVPLVGIYSPLLFATGVSQKDVHCIVAFDAKKNRVFGARYFLKSFLPQEEIPPGDYDIDHLLNDVHKPLIAIGDGAEKYTSKILEKHSNATILTNFKPNIENIFDFIEYVYNKNPNNYIDYRNVKPYYARKSDAEIMREQK